MTRPKLLLPSLLLTAAALLGGCKSGPAKLCDKIDALAVKASTEGDEASKKMAMTMQAESSTCLSRMQALEQQHPEQFANASACVEEATELRNVVQCFFKAAMNKAEMKGAAATKKE